MRRWNRKIKQTARVAGRTNHVKTVLFGFAVVVEADRDMQVEANGVRPHKAEKYHLRSKWALKVYSLLVS